MWVAPEAGSSLGIEERREDDLVAVEAGPAQVDVRLAVPVGRHDVCPQPAGDEFANAFRNGAHAGESQDESNDAGRSCRAARPADVD